MNNPYNWNKWFTKENTQIANKRENYTNPLMIREMKIRTLRYQFIPTRMAIIISEKTITTVKDAEKWEFSNSAGGNAK